MPRIKDLENTTKRTKSVLLDKESFLILKELTKYKNFNFSSFVNKKIKESFGGVNREQVLLNQLNMLCDKENELLDLINQDKIPIIKELKSIREKVEVCQECQM